MVSRSSYQHDLEGKVAVVTGASKGIGRAIATNLARRGCSVLGTCATPQSLHLIRAIAEDIGSSYKEEPNANSIPTIQAVVADLSSANTPSIIADALSAYFKNALDIFVNNAASTIRTRIGSLAASDINNLCTANIQTPSLMIDQLVRRKMFRADSRIVFISSAETTRCNPDTLLYNATKAAGEALVRTYANAFGGRDERFAFMAGTTVNSVFTGLTETSGIHAFGQEVYEELRRGWVEHQCLPRLAQPQDIADIVGLLCSHEARWITGSKVSADGGGIKIT